MEYRSSELTVAWFSQHVNDDSLVIRPPFQRKPVWTDKQKSHLIESILLQLPIPEIYMTSEVEADGTTTHLVVDGQQRITSILEFLGIGGFESFELKGLSVDSRWEGTAFNALSDEDKRKFYSYPLSVRLLSDASYSDIKSLFVRFNKYLTPLNSQELRHATYGGPFTQLAEELADDTYWAENRIVDPKSIRRMKDVEFTSDLIIGVMHGPQSGNARTLDEYYGRYEMEESFPHPVTTRRKFMRTLDAIQSIYPNIKDTRWRNRSDFYSLFVALANRQESIRTDNAIGSLRDSLNEFASAIQFALDRERPDRPLDGPEHVVAYIGAIRRGSSDRARRVARQRALDVVFDQASAGAN